MFGFVLGLFRLNFFVGVAQGNTISGCIQVCSRYVVTSDEKLEVFLDVLMTVSTGLTEYFNLLYKLPFVRP